MNRSDFKPFAERWADIHDAMPGGKVFSQRTMTIVFDALEDYSLEAVFQAIKIHMKKGKFAPSPADIVEIIAGHTGQKHIGSDEAWCLALDSLNEDLTVIVTAEIVRARGLVMDIYKKGDVTGARMAFRDAYNRIISTASSPSWFVSEGFDEANRADAVQKAVGLGRLPASVASKYLIEAPATTVAGLIESANEKAGKSANQKYKEKFKKAIQETNGILRAPDDDGIARREQERFAFEKHRQEMLDRVAQKLQEKVQPVAISESN
jgi:hypothetical protein